MAFTNDALRRVGTALHQLNPLLLRGGGASHDVAKKPRPALSPEARPLESPPKCSTVGEARVPHVRTVQTVTPPAAAMRRRSSTSGPAPPTLFDLSPASVVAMGPALPQLDNETRAVRIPIPRCALLSAHPPLSTYRTAVLRDQEPKGVFWGTSSVARQPARTSQRCATAVAEIHSSWPTTKTL